MIPRSVGIVVAALALGCAPASAQAGGAEQARTLMERAAARYDSVPSLCADFVQTLSVPLLGEERSGRGRLCQARPDRFAMRFTEPAGDAVVVDGTWVWMYYPSVNPDQVLRFPMAQAQGGFDFHRAFLEDFAAKYDLTLEGTDSLDGGSAHRIRLDPKTSMSFRRAVVWVESSGILRQIRVEEENGSVRTLKLDRVDMGARPPVGWFTFTVPAGVQILSG
ncbi:MAG TPA: outer membrane lipoprotein carrier protein LolA [Longimicrobiales bacterium]|nr:outer membrane lipoprotein carrier protein LolA [Longimicrobiales bacterium]